MSSLEDYVRARLAEGERIEPVRAAELERLAGAIAALPGEVALTFICTHNSRRSHMAQIWAQAAARRFGLDHVRTFSGGTEATAFEPRAVAAMRRAGFAITIAEAGDNPVYEVRGAGDEPLNCFSKTFDDPANPRADFVAVMTCASADAACPIVPGAALRASIRYEDPKAFDGTELEAEAYDERCAQIAREMLWLFRRVAERG